MRGTFFRYGQDTDEEEADEVEEAEEETPAVDEALDEVEPSDEPLAIEAEEDDAEEEPEE